MQNQSKLTSLLQNWHAILLCGHRKLAAVSVPPFVENHSRDTWGVFIKKVKSGGRADLGCVGGTVRENDVKLPVSMEFLWLNLTGPVWTQSIQMENSLGCVYVCLRWLHKSAGREHIQLMLGTIAPPPHYSFCLALVDHGH